MWENKCLKKVICYQSPFDIVEPSTQSITNVWTLVPTAKITSTYILFWTIFILRFYVHGFFNKSDLYKYHSMKFPAICINQPCLRPPAPITRVVIIDRSNCTKMKPACKRLNDLSWLAAWVGGLVVEWVFRNVCGIGWGLVDWLLIAGLVGWLVCWLVKSQGLCDTLMPILRLEKCQSS